MTSASDTVLYRRAIEALRNGVPNADAVRVLGSNQERVEQAFTEKLASVQESLADGSQVSGLLIQGGFGSGKSHLLKYLEDRASSQHFVCSRIVISKETPLFDPAKVYRAAIENAVVPGRGGPAIQTIAHALRPDTPAYADLFKWANSAGSGLSELFPATLLLHERLNNDPELVEKITNFWSGDKLSIADVRQGLRQIGQAATFSIKRVRERELAVQRFAFAPRLMIAAGYRGWVLLIDEVELIGRYSALQRGKSYAELARWMGKVEGEEYPGLVAVATITDDYAARVLEEKGDLDTIGPRLRSRDTDEFNIMAARAEGGMRIIEREAITLVPPDDSVLDQTYRKLRDLHARAYRWEPPDVEFGARMVRRAMRSYVRRLINEWDLKRLYPELTVHTEEQDLTPSYEEEPELEQSSGDDSSSDGPVGAGPDADSISR